MGFVDYCQTLNKYNCIQGNKLWQIFGINIKIFFNFEKQRVR